MLTKNTLIVALIAALPALAQQDVQPQPNPDQQSPHWGARGQMPDRKGRPDKHQRMLEKFDANKDGKLDEQERNEMKASVKKFREERNEKRQERREEFRKNFMEKFDTDKDGKLSDEEKEAAKKQRHERRGPKGKRGHRPMPPAGAPATLEL